TIKLSIYRNGHLPNVKIYPIESRASRLTKHKPNSVNNLYFCRCKSRLNNQANNLKKISLTPIAMKALYFHAGFCPPKESHDGNVNQRQK
ncbi:hypothetical protein, partial [Serratia fonticola]|uniref:hypothetical protein n=1 Tax=Serratia fonticola TaxID=47917 RepID=UPI003AAA59E8